MTDRPGAAARAGIAARTVAGGLIILLSLWLAAAPAVVGSKVVLATAGGSPDWLLGVFAIFGADSLGRRRRRLDATTCR